MLAVLLVLAGCGSQPAPVEAPAVPSAAEPASPLAEQAPVTKDTSSTEIDIEAFHAKHSAGEIPLLIDVRTPSEWNSGHVPGAVHIPMQEIGKRLAELDAHKDGPIYFICASGGRSGRVSVELQKKGYQAVNVLGGTGAWRTAGHPVE